MDCNNDCLFCSIPKKEVSLTYEEICRKIDRYKKDGFDQVTITGGEPTLHPDLIRIIEYIKKNGMAARLVTNGTQLTEERIRQLIDAKLNYLTFSVHTLDGKKAKIISDNTDYDLSKVISMVKYAVKKGLHVYYNITITKMNYKELPDIAKFIVKELSGIHMINFNYVDIWGNTALEKNKDEMSVRYYLAELYFIEAFNILKKNNVNFRAERIPLCYLVGFEEYSSDYNRITNLEEPKTDFIERNVVEVTGKDYKKGDACKSCRYSKNCFGLANHYADTYGFKELYPIFNEIKEII